jgi:hypothetical protein
MRVIVTRQQLERSPTPSIGVSRRRAPWLANLVERGAEVSR